jgi:hypothetical protein
MRRAGKVSAAAAVALLAAGAAVGCSTNMAAGTTCPTVLAQVGCAATFDLQASQGGTCGGACYGLGGTCGPYVVWQTAPGTSGLSCVYDGTGQTLLAATACSDVESYCAGTQFCASGGANIDPSTACDLRTLPNACPCTDGGADVAADAVDAAAE